MLLTWTRTTDVPGKYLLIWSSLVLNFSCAFKSPKAHFQPGLIYWGACHLNYIYFIWSFSLLVLIVVLWLTAPPVRKTPTPRYQVSPLFLKETQLNECSEAIISHFHNWDSDLQRTVPFWADCCFTFHASRQVYNSSLSVLQTSQDWADGIGSNICQSEYGADFTTYKRCNWETYQQIMNMWAWLAEIKPNTSVSE